jgi:hypothetical protein
VSEFECGHAKRFAEAAARYDQNTCQCKDRDGGDLCANLGCGDPLEDHGFHSMFCLQCGCMCYVCPRCKKDHPGL